MRLNKSIKAGHNKNSYNFFKLQAKKFVDELKHKYTTLCETSKTVLDNLNQSVHDHQQYQDALKDFNDWLKFAHDNLEICADHSGDKLSLKSKKDRLKVS